MRMNITHKYIVRLYPMNEIAGMVLACMGTLTPVEIHLEIWSSHEYLSACHVASTERGFDYPKQQCFCIDVRDIIKGD